MPPTRNLRVFVLQFPECTTESLETPTVFPEFGPGSRNAKSGKMERVSSGFLVYGKLAWSMTAPLELAFCARDRKLEDTKGSVIQCASKQDK